MGMSKDFFRNVLDLLICIPYNAGNTIMERKA